MSIREDLRAVERDLARRGYFLVRDGKHRIWRHPTLGVFVVPKPHATGDPRAIRNLRADLKRRKERT